MPGTFISPAELRCTTPPAAAAGYSAEQLLDFTDELLLEPSRAETLAGAEEGYTRAEGFADAQASSRFTSSGVLLLGGTRLRPPAWKEPYGWLRLAESAYAGAGAAVLPPPPGAADSWSAFDARFEVRISASDPYP